MIRCLDAANRFSCPPGELSIALLTTDAMSALHARFLGDASPTDVITFEGDESAGLAGEICVCSDVARKYAESRGQDFPAELTLYIAHGYLHLCGHDDVESAARRRMRTAERAAMQVVRTANAIPAFRWATVNE